MDLYRIICPYCKYGHLPIDCDREGYDVVVCDECDKPFVNRTTWAAVYNSYAIVDVEQSEEPIEMTAERGQEKPVVVSPVLWYRGPGKEMLYSITPTHVYIINQMCPPARLSWGTVEYLLSYTGEDRVREISETLGENAQVRQKLGVAMFLKALEKDKIPHDRISYYRQMIE